MKRIDDGHRLCNDLMNCIQERAKIEKSYSQQLTDWSKRWRQLIDKGQKVYLLVFLFLNVTLVLHMNPDAHLVNPRLRTSVRQRGASLGGADGRGREDKRAPP